MTCIRHIAKPDVREPTAIVGSPGMRSVGDTAVNHLISILKPELVAEVYSQHFPIIHGTKPSFSPNPDYPGQAGVQLQTGRVQLPRIELYLSNSPPLLITKGYHAEFKGQYEVANRVLDLFTEFGVKRMIVLAGCGTGSKEVCCAATDLELMGELKKYDLDAGYEGPFYGFSGLVFGLGTLRGMKGVCLFGRSQPNPDDPEFPDPQTANAVLQKVGEMLNLTITKSV